MIGLFYTVLAHEDAAHFLHGKNQSITGRETRNEIILTGDRPTGRLHLGHYVGSLRRRVELQNSSRFDEVNILIADDQALTDNADDPGKIRDNIVNVALDYLSAGIDPDRATI